MTRRRGRTQSGHGQGETALNTGKLARLNRIFSHSSGRICTVAVDHLVGFSGNLPMGLRRIQPTLASIVSARPDAVTMHKGTAATAWRAHAGAIPLIIQSVLARVDDVAPEVAATPEEAVRLGADAIAVAAFISGRGELSRLRVVADCVRYAARFELPVICHVYPRDLTGEPKVSFAPDDIAWAVHCAAELGADVVKTPYCGDVASHAQIVAECPVPVVAAGGPRAPTLAAALQAMSEVVRSGARGATIGRNVWGHEHIAEVIEAFKAVIHDERTPEEALRRAGL
jgi:class I fructose-bisphosphate aldolase